MNNIISAMTDDASVQNSHNHFPSECFKGNIVTAEKKVMPIFVRIHAYYLPVPEHRSPLVFSKCHK
jgi:hypothetical protein